MNIRRFRLWFALAVRHACFRACCRMDLSLLPFGLGRWVWDRAMRGAFDARRA